MLEERLGDFALLGALDVFLGFEADFVGSGLEPPDPPATTLPPAATLVVTPLTTIVPPPAPPTTTVPSATAIVAPPLTVTVLVPLELG